MTTELPVPDNLMDIRNFPKYEYTYKVLKFIFEAGLIEVEYLPVDERLTKVSFAIPVLANFDVNNLDALVDQFAPHDRWFAQEKMLEMSNIIQP